MENYILWGATTGEGTLALLVTRVNLQRVGKGTPFFVHALLEELGIGAEPKSWSIESHFLTDYLTSDPDSTAWEDSWSETWDFHIAVDVSHFQVPDPNDLRRTASYDDTAGDEELTFPVPVVLFAEFDTAEHQQSAEHDLQQLLSGAAGAGPDATSVALRTAIEAIPADRRAALSVSSRGPLLQVSLGPSAEDFVESSKALLDAIRAWIKERGGAATWNERHT
ncbi:MAG: hypothetical protein ABI779_23075 [Acidobacteriota bacterium]